MNRKKNKFLEKLYNDISSLIIIKNKKDGKINKKGTFKKKKIKKRKTRKRLKSK